jgi:hypothetical protein
LTENAQDIYLVFYMQLTKSNTEAAQNWTTIEDTPILNDLRTLPLEFSTLSEGLIFKFHPSTGISTQTKIEMNKKFVT